MSILKQETMADSEAEQDEKLCRLCFDAETQSIDPLLKPCRCAGSMAYIHESCLMRYRVSSFDPSTLTTCKLCRTNFRTIDIMGSINTPERARRELYFEIFNYVSSRIGFIIILALILGFLPGIFDIDMPVLFDNMIGNHFAKGILTTLICSGSWVFVKLYSSIGVWGRFLNQPWRGARGRGKDDTFVVALICAGVVFILYNLVKGVGDILYNARVMTDSSVRCVNQQLRENIAKRYKVINFIEVDQIDQTFSQPDID